MKISAKFLVLTLGMLCCSVLFAETQTAFEQGVMRGFPPSEAAQVTRANWMTPPFNRWAYQNTRRIHPSMTFPRATAQRATPMPYAPMNKIAQMTVKAMDGKKVSIDEFLRETYTDGIVVVHNGRVVYERYFNGLSPSQPHLLFSVTKSFTGTLVGLLADRGLIDFDKTVADYVPELAKSGFGDATVRQMMSMEVGVAWDETPEAMADPSSTFSRYAQAVGFIHGPEISSTFAVLPTMQKVNPHGDHFQYVAPATDALGWLLERVSGKPYAQLLDDEILSKIGLEGDGYILLDGWGKALATGGLNLTTRDLARFGVMLQQGGNFGGQRIVSEEFIHDTRFNGSREKFRKGQAAENFQAYHNQWWIMDGPRPAMNAWGVFGQMLYVQPDSGVVIARVTSTPSGNDPSDPHVQRLFMRINDLLAKH